MPVRTNDCCSTCEFNAIHQLGGAQAEGEQAFLCRIRQLAIASPFWTFCNNHQRRNPLLIREPRGPLWGAVSHPPQELPLSPRVLAIPELVPPRDVPGEYRLPYCGDQRPLDSGAGTCAVCGAATDHAIAVSHEASRICFCSVAHYLEWWLENAPESGSYGGRVPVERGDLEENLIVLMDELAEMDTQPPSKLDTGHMLDLMRGLEGIIAQTLHGYPDLARVQDALAGPAAKGSPSPHLLVILSRMAELGELRQAELADRRAMHRRVHQIRMLLESYLAGEPLPKPAGSDSRWWRFWR